MTKNDFEKFTLFTLDQLEVRMSQLAPLVDEYHEISHVIRKRKEDLSRQMYESRLRIIMSRTSYIGPEYPSMGEEGYNGSCFLQTKEDAYELLEVLRMRADYYHSFVLLWTEPGDYTVEPDYKYDHDREIVYTATIKRRGTDEV